ncbi:superoxide dismutase [Cu-Zn] SodC [Alteromonas oceanisediminis]|uniref:superoxide dismutase [Cu-Zn] SodC n=1 Tax=Alteromonas oceanisediminis TaxID=2836180 RepID=UPI002023B747
MIRRKFTGLLLCSAFAMSCAHAESSQTKTITLQDLSTEQSVGHVTVSESDHGLVFTPNLSGLTPGIHGFHVHENPDCGTAVKEGETIIGGAAGSHYDPENTNNHGYPWSEDAHLGDLPALYVAQDGTAATPVLAPRLSLDDIDARALIIHAHGDNYSDTPKPLGGGGKRVACGVIDFDKQSHS